MRHVLLIAEMGGELGHLATLSALSAALCQRGDKVTVLVRELARAVPHFSGQAVTLLQAPVWRRALPVQTPRGSMATILYRYGFASPSELYAYLQAWRDLVDLLRPDLLVLDYAPTAWLALRDRHVPLLVTGFAFGAPVPGQPLPEWTMPSLTTAVTGQWPSLELADVERQVLATINECQHQDRLSPLASVSELFVADGMALSQLAELDPQQPWREPACYAGPLTPALVGKPVHWQSSTSKRVLAYIKPGWPKLEILLQQLHEQGVELEAFYRGPLPTEWQRWLGPTFRIGSQPLDLRSALCSADLMICHAGIGSLSLALGAGCPSLCLPQQTEQRGNSELVVQQGWGAQLTGDESLEQMAACLQSYWQHDGYRCRTREVAARYHQSPTPLSRLLATCDRLLARGGD